jgi:hypothetical protein
VGAITTEPKRDTSRRKGFPSAKIAKTVVAILELEYDHHCAAFENKKRELITS